ncbi:MAG: AraC family transcriptional regulator [Eubacteriales bacterium]|nr:AraC family transcriptional regulator [Eubacteriales bacterium]
MIQIHTTDNQREMKAHGDYHFPVHISEESIGIYEGGAFMWHWHPEIELTWVQSGIIDYRVNEQQYILQQDEGLFCNSNVLHSGYMKDQMNCEYLSITFHPRFIYGYETSLLQTKYVEFITANPRWSSLVLSPEVSWQAEILDTMRQIYSWSKQPPLDYELRVHLAVTRIWQLLFQYFASLPVAETQIPEHLDRLKQILIFIQEHYSEPLTLEDIAASASICKSECCRFFKKHMHMTLFDYLLFYRIQQSLPLLRGSDSITNIAGMVGFSNPCYYGKIFKRYMNCSPREYRKEV